MAWDVGRFNGQGVRVCGWWLKRPRAGGSRARGTLPPFHSVEQGSAHRGEALLAETDTLRSPEAAAEKLGYTLEGWNELTPRQKRQESENYRQAEIDAEQWGVDVRLVRLITMAMHVMASAIGCWPPPLAVGVIRRL